MTLNPEYPTFLKGKIEEDYCPHCRKRVRQYNIKLKDITDETDNKNIGKLKKEIVELMADALSNQKQTVRDSINVYNQLKEFLKKEEDKEKIFKFKKEYERYFISSIDNYKLFLTDYDVNSYYDAELKIVKNDLSELSNELKYLNEGIISYIHFEGDDYSYSLNGDKIYKKYISFKRKDSGNSLNEYLKEINLCPICNNGISGMELCPNCNGKNLHMSFEEID